MAESWSRTLERWVRAGLIDPESEARIRAFEGREETAAGLSRPVWFALGFGALLMAAGVLLFVSAHWDALSPRERLLVAIAPLVLLHVAGGWASSRFPAMAVALHGIGTVALGAGIFLTGQIFNLAEHWPSGFMLWTIGAAIAWALLDEWPQLAILAVMAPIWLGGEWAVAAGAPQVGAAARVSAAGGLLFALVAFTAIRNDAITMRRRTLLWVGGLMLPVSAIALATAYFPASAGAFAPAPPSLELMAIGWTVAIGLPLVVAVIVHRRASWPLALAGAWIVVASALRAIDGTTGTLLLFAWWALGAIGLVAWGVFERRPERVNMGAAAFAATTLAFYFSQVMDRLGQSASLIGLGVLFLAGGWLLERTRRELVRKVKEQQS